MAFAMYRPECQRAEPWPRAAKSKCRTVDPYSWLDSGRVTESRLGTQLALRTNSIYNLPLSPLQMETGNVRVRRLSPQDLPAVRRLHKFAKDKATGQPIFGTDQTGVMQMLDAAAEGTAAFGWVAVQAEDDAEVLGALVAEEQLSANPSTAEAIVLLTMVVRADARGTGVGRRLLDSLRLHAKQSGVSVIHTDVATANGPAMTYFKRAGFKQKGSRGRSVELELTCGMRSELTRGRLPPTAVVAATKRRMLAAKSTHQPLRQRALMRAMPM